MCEEFRRLSSDEYVISHTVVFRAILLAEHGSSRCLEFLDGRLEKYVRNGFVEVEENIAKGELVVRWLSDEKLEVVLAERNR